MNKYLIPILILLWSLLYSWFWNCERRPYCADGDYDANAIVAPVIIDEANAVAEIDTLEAVEAAEEELLFTPLDVYFEAAKAGINHTAEIDNFLATAKKYLAAHADSHLNLVGHTDSDATDATNDPLSVNRANQVKDFLIAEGFSASQLITSGRGEREPIASNATAEGKAKNRRVTIRLAE